MSDHRFFRCNRPESDQPFHVAVLPDELPRWEALQPGLRSESWWVEPCPSYPIKKCYSVDEVERRDL